MSVKIPRLTEENKLFLSKNNLTLKDVAFFFKIKPVTLRNSTAKNTKIDALRAYEKHLRKNDRLILKYDNKDDFDYYKGMALDRIKTEKLWYLTINDDLLAIDDYCTLHKENVKLEFDDKDFILYFSCCT